MRTKKEKTFGPVSMPRHEAQQKLAEYIEEYTGRVAKQGDAIATFSDLWAAFWAVESGQSSKKTREDLRYLFTKHVIPVVGSQPPRAVTLMQLLLNKMAEDGYRKSAVEKIRTHTRACFEYATDGDLIQKNPTRKLVMPNIQKKSCERFLSMDELRALLSQASLREHLVLRILAACGLRPAEILVLRIEDYEGTQLRIDEALRIHSRGKTQKAAQGRNQVLTGRTRQRFAGRYDVVVHGSVGKMSKRLLTQLALFKPPKVFKIHSQVETNRPVVVFSAHGIGERLTLGMALNADVGGLHVSRRAGFTIFACDGWRTCAPPGPWHFSQPTFHSVTVLVSRL